MTRTAEGGAVSRVKGMLRRVEHTYAQDGERPIRGYLVAMSAFAAYTTSWALLVRRRGRPLPDRPVPWDVALTAVATFRLSRC